MITAKSIGIKLTSARKSKNFSQSTLAQELAVSPQAVGKWERGESLPDIILLSRIAALLSVDLNYFSEVLYHYWFWLRVCDRYGHIQPAY